MITIKEEQIRTLVANVYNLSTPVGLGFLQYESGSLTDEEIDELIDMGSSCVVAMDYVKGRQCKFGIFQNSVDGSLEVKDYWPDHSPWEYAVLLDSADVPIPKHLQTTLSTEKV